MSKSPVLIIGGGVIGLSIGWQLARRGQKVQLFERDESGKGASWVSAGMLSPGIEAGYEEPELLKLGLESRRLYPQFLQELREDSKVEIRLGKSGSLVIALGRDDEEALKRFFDFRVTLGLSVRWLSGGEAREIEPLLSPQVVSAVSVPDDLQVDPRKLVTALKAAFLNKGGTLNENSRVDKLLIENEKIQGLEIQNKKIPSAKIILAAGCWSSQITGIPEDARPPVRPVKGQILTLRTSPSCELSRVIHAPDAYLVPKSNHRLLVGATSEEMGYDLSKGSGHVMDLLKGAYEAVPAIYDSVLEEIQVGLRPGTLDNLPLLGETPTAGLYYATGHFRHGILLTPITAYEVSKSILQHDAPWLAPFSPSRFAPSGMQRGLPAGSARKQGKPALKSEF